MKRYLKKINSITSSELKDYIFAASLLWLIKYNGHKEISMGKLPSRNI